MRCDETDLPLKATDDVESEGVQFLHDTSDMEGGKTERLKKAKDRRAQEAADAD
jgi:hypothetical protein